jgi:hypothetical protein
MPERKDFQMHPVSLNDLEKQWVAHGNKFEEFVFGAAEARRKHSTAKALIKTAKAEAAVQIRNSPSEFDIEKITEKAVEMAVDLHPVVEKAVREEIQAKYELDLWDAAVETMGERRAVLANLVDLHARGYFSSMSLKPEHREAMEATKKKATYKNMSPRRKAEDDD